MLFDPDWTLSDVERTLCLADRHFDLPWNVCRTELFVNAEDHERRRKPKSSGSIITCAARS